MSTTDRRSLIGPVVIVLAALAFTVLRYWVTLSTDFTETHDKRHIDVLSLKICLYLIVSLVFFGFFARKLAPTRLDLLTYLILAALIVSVLTLAYTDVYKTHGIIDTLNGATTRNTIDCYYFSIVTWTTVGYGDFRPTEAGRLFAASEAIVGLTFMGLFISVLFYLLNKISYQEAAKAGNL
jgi:hypothetical protein